MKQKYDLVCFEIVGFCNAKCPWCITGNKSLNKASSPSGFINVDDFENAIDYLLDNGFIGPGESRIYLYSWGEPMLHPDLNGILKILSKNNIDFGISTNASKVVDFDRDVLANLYDLKFSMPGFSQSSYDRVHGFSFDRILENIKTLVRNIESEGAGVNFTMAYHLYQFNIGEINPAVKFCQENGIDFVPYVAYLNDFYLSKAYLDKSINRELLERVSKDLFLYYIDELIAKMPQNYQCPQFNILTIDEYCNALTCCVLPKDHPEYSLGSIFELSYNEIREMKRTRKICNDCIKSGVTYWVSNVVVPDYIKDFRYILELEKSLRERDLELQNKANLINTLLNSKPYKLGRAFTWPIRCVVDRLK